jgi:signal transduction histidine kinase
VRLQTKLTLAFAAVTLVPIGVLGGVARLVIANQYRAEFRRALEHAENETEREYQRLTDETAETLKRFARSDDPFLGQLVVDLAKGGLDDERRRDLPAEAEAQMRALGLDVLTLVDERGEILAAPHFPGRVGDKDTAAATLARAQGPQLVEEQVMDGGRARPRLAIEWAREVQASFSGARARLTVVGGRALDQRFVDRLHPGARLEGPDGKTLLGPPARGKAWPETVVEFKRGDGSVAARVAISIPDDELRHTLELIGWATLGLAFGALALALLLGAGVARRMGRPLVDLAEGARAVAKGNLEARVPVRGQDEVAELANAFNAMIEDLAAARDELVRAERVAAWREIAQRIAHEIKNPLTPIQMAIETLQRAQQKSAAQFDALFAESAKTILDEVARLKHIVSEFSRFARMPAPELKPVDVGEAIDGALALYAGSGLPLDRAIDAGLPRAMADRDQLHQVLINLLENARDAVDGSASGRVRVAARVTAGRIEIEVADTGPGISDEVRARLFTPYFTTKAKGTGLGLAIVHRIVSDHGGEIRVGGRAGEGAVFVVLLPTAS